ncbi:GIY-YIG nuclease family protein [Lacinutrix iliipiscaria]|uniref:GIY-YIG nuclease family protein n=1 Tax=Lacinutrix iliipiscaria TaxID=1230532 RepID=A0ABW5WSJ4_9FLAO
MQFWYIYIMTNKPNGTIYIGITNEIQERIKEHKLKIRPKSFTAKYNCDKLVYFEEYSNDKDALIRERQMKKWKREWKIKLIEDMNPSWTDISINWNLNYNKFRNER